MSIGYDNSTVRSHHPGINLRGLVMWLLTAFVFAIPFENIVSLPLIGTPTRVLGLLTAPLAVAAVVSSGRFRLKPPTLFVILGFFFVLWNFASFYWSRAPSATLSGTFTYAQLIVFVWMMSEFFRNRDALLLLLQAFVLGCYVAFGIAAVNTLVLGTGGYRTTGPFDANEFATVLALGIPMAAWLVSSRRSSRLRLVNLLYPLVATLGIVLGASRGGLIVGLITLASIPLTLAHIGTLRRLGLLTATLAAVWFAFVAAPTLFPGLVENLERLGTTGAELTGGTLTGRTLIWSETLGLIEESPIVGLGSRAPRHVLAERVYGRERAVHNTPLSIAAETGLVGLLFFVAIVSTSWFSAFMAPSPARTFTIILLLALLAGMMPLSLEVRKVTWFVLAIAAGQVPISVSFWVAETRSGFRNRLRDGLRG